MVSPSPHLRRRLFLACLLTLLLQGCASQLPRVFQLDTSGRVQAGTAQVWPAPPQVPRYMHVGDLLGEQNFPAAAQRPGGFWQGLWRILTGIDGDERRPQVLQRPQGGTSDRQGRVFVTDVSRQAVYVFDPAAQGVKVWEWAGPGRRFVAPVGVLPDGDGGVLVCDAELGLVARLDADGRPAGIIGASVLTRPTGIARDPDNGDIYVADTRANDVKVFDAEGRLVRLIGQAGDERGALNSPTYLAFKDGRLYVADTLNSRIQIYDREGEVLQMFGKRGLFVGNLARPKGVAVDDEGNIYVVESYFDYLLVYDREGRLMLPIGGTGSASGEFYLPAGVWVDERNRVYVADMFNGRVSVFQFLGGG